MRLVLWIAAIVVATPAKAEEAKSLDPKSYLDEKARTEAANPPPSASLVKQNVVTIAGRPYYKFGNGKGTILVPKVANLSKLEMERAVCGETLKSICNQTGDAASDKLCQSSGMSEAIAARAAYALTEETTIYADLIFSTIQRSCGSDAPSPSAADLHSAFELGVEWKNQDPRHPGSKKIFIRPVPGTPIGGGITF